VTSAALSRQRRRQHQQQQQQPQDSYRMLYQHKQVMLLCQQQLATRGAYCGRSLTAWWSIPAAWMSLQRVRLLLRVA
jgi:hypothetical protein